MENEQIATKTALDTLVRENQNAKDADQSEHGAQAIEQSNKTRQNLIITMLGTCYRFVKKQAKSFVNETPIVLRGVLITDSVGLTNTYSPILKIIANKADALIIYVTQALHSPELITLIEIIVRLFN